MTDSSSPPQAFMSYSHDSDDHRAWVLRLADRLVRNGVDVTLDRWGIRYGDDIGRFIEQGVVGAQWFIAVCTPRYVEKANAGEGGAGYEKTILTPSLMKSTDEKRVIPVWRENPDRLLPTFVGARLAADFNDDAAFEERYAALLRTLHGREIVPRPPLGPNPFEGDGPAVPAFSPERYVDPNLSGVVTFDYSNNDGTFEIGAGELQFSTHWSGASDSAIHCYRGGNLASVALVRRVRAVTEIGDGAQYDTSSRVRTPNIGEFMVIRNRDGYYAALQVLGIVAQDYNGDHDSVTFAFWIIPDRSADFSRIKSSAWLPEPPSW
jgi:hypothetical protein